MEQHEVLNVRPAGADGLVDAGRRCVDVLGPHEALVRRRADVDNAADQAAAGGVAREARQNLVGVLVAALSCGDVKEHLFSGVAVLLAEVEVRAGGARVLRRDIVDTPADGKLRVEARWVGKDGGGGRRGQVCELVFADGGMKGGGRGDVPSGDNCHDAALVLGGAPVVVGGLPEAADKALDVAVEAPKVPRNGQVVQRGLEEKRPVAEQPERLVCFCDLWYRHRVYCVVPSPKSSPPGCLSQRCPAGRSVLKYSLSTQRHSRREK